MNTTSRRRFCRDHYGPVSDDHPTMRVPVLDQPVGVVEVVRDDDDGLFVQGRLF